ncbi:MAG: aldose 1-epimerase family protein, partial [Cytophagaceae bacterium]|nr:aldose 1-epimerase family protein [Cytophagaceae bacterium]
MLEKIENDFLKIEISSHGAELKSIQSKKNNKEYLWQGDQAFWPRRAPVLFPIVGKLHQNKYRIGNKTFEMGQHGFARDKNFELIDKDNTSVTYSFKANPDTLKVYPYQFELLIRYSIVVNRLHVDYEVVNTDKDKIYFTIGAHPGFICPLNEGEEFTDYFLEFQKEEEADRHLLDDGLLNGKTEKILNNEKVLNLTEDLFKKDAIVLKNLKSCSMKLKSKKSDYQLKVDFSGFRYMGIWKKPGAPFICIEPWVGIADKKDFSGELKEKEGIKHLNEGEMFTAGFII